MKLWKMLSTLWKYRNYDTVYLVCYTNRACDSSIPIRRAKLVGLTVSRAFVVLLDGTKLIVHRSYVTYDKQEANRVRKVCLDYEREMWYE